MAERVVLPRLEAARAGTGIGILKALGEESKRNRTDWLSLGEIGQVIRKTRARKNEALMLSLGRHIWRSDG